LKLIGEQQATTQKHMHIFSVALLLFLPLSLASIAPLL